MRLQILSYVSPCFHVRNSSPYLNGKNAKQFEIFYAHKLSDFISNSCSLWLLCSPPNTELSRRDSARDSTPAPARKLLAKLTSAETTLYGNTKDWHLWYHQSASEIKDTSVVLQSTLQGWSQLGYSTDIPCNTTAGLGASPHMPRCRAVPSATYTISCRIQSRQYENTRQRQPMNFANINLNLKIIYT